MQGQNRMGQGKADSKRRRDALKREYGELFHQVSVALVQADSIGLIADGAPADEYDPEVGSILPRLKEADGPGDVQRIVWEEFVRWFGPETVGGVELYASVASVVWEAWQQFSSRRR